MPDEDRPPARTLGGGFLCPLAGAQGCCQDGPMGFPPERRPASTGKLGLQWATLPRMPHPGIQYVVAPALDDGSLDMAHGVQDAWRDPAQADAARDAAERTWPAYTFHVWSREIGWFRIDD